MELSRRDALAALAASGVAVGGGAVVLDHRGPDASGARAAGPDSGSGHDSALDDHVVDTLVAVGGVVYPTAVSGVEPFVSTYLQGRARDDPSFRDGVRTVVDRIDDMSEAWFGHRYADLDAETRDRALRAVGAETANPDPEGSPAERIRYYLVNELLYALYTSPAGGELVGIENPQGHPGGRASYQQGPGSKP